MIAYLERLARMHREDAAYALARSEESREEIKAELDEVKAGVIKLGGKVERLEDRVNTIVNAQIVQGAQINDLKKDQHKLQETFEGAMSGVVGRMIRVESRVDSLERTFAQFREMVLADVDVRRKQLALEEAKNGDAPKTPKVQPDTAGGPETLRPKK